MAKLPSAESLSGERPSLLVGGSVRGAQPEPVPHLGQEAEGLAALARGLDKTSDSFAALEVRDRERDDALKATQAVNQLQDARIDLTVGDQNGFRKKVLGEQATDPSVQKTYETRFNDAAKRIRDSLGNEDQRRRFDMEQGHVRLSYQSDLLTHIGNQKEKAEDDSLKSTIETEKRASALSGNDPEALGNSLMRVDYVIGKYGESRGFSNQRIADMRADATSGILASSLHAQRLTDPVGALQTYQVMAPSINIEQRVKLEESLFADASPVMAAQLLQGPLRTVAANEAEAIAITQIGAAMNKPVSVTVDPERASKEFNTVFDRLPPDQKLKVLHLAKTQADQGMTQMRQGLNIRAHDAAAALERGQPAPDVPTPAELVTAFGPEAGAKMARDLAAAKTFGDAYTRVASAPRAEQQALLLKMTPDSTQPGFAEGQRRFEQFAGVIDRVRKEQDQDPAGYVLSQSPARQRVLKGIDSTDVRSAYELFTQAQNDPQIAPQDKANAARGYAAATIAEQRRLGIENPQVLPKGMVDGIAKRFGEPPAQGENPANVMRGMVDQWGPYWPAVGKQLKGKLPPEMEVIGLGVTPEAEALLGEALRLTSEQRKEGQKDTKEYSDLKERVRRQFEPLQRSIAFQSGGQSTYDNYVDAAAAMSQLLVRRGMSEKQAAEKSFDSLVGFKYDFEDSWRVPKTELGGSVTTGMLRSGAEAMKRDISSDKPVLGDKVALRIPDYGPGVRPQDADRQWRDTIKAEGFWVTSPGDGGLTLYVKSRLGAQPVMDDRGQPVTRSWDQISGIGRATRAAYFSDVSRGRKVIERTPTDRQEQKPAPNSPIIGVRG